MEEITLQALKDCAMNNFDKDSLGYKWIESVKSNQEFLNSVIRISMSGEVLEIRQLGAIIIKNLWSSEGISTRSVKIRILPCLEISVHPLIRSQFEQLFFALAFKENDGEMIREATEILACANSGKEYAAMNAIRLSLKANRLQNRNSSEIFNIDAMFNACHQVFYENAETKWDFTYIFLKIRFYLLLQTKKHNLADPLYAFLQLIFSILPTANRTSQVQKCEKACVKIIYHTTQMSSLEFTNISINNWLLSYLDSIIFLLNQFPSIISLKTIAIAFRFQQAAAFLSEKVEILLIVILKILTPSIADEENMKFNVPGFINDEMSDSDTLKEAAFVLILVICEEFSRSLVLEFLANSLESSDLLVQMAALHCFAVVFDEFSEEEIVVQMVLAKCEEFSGNPAGLVRFRACWVLYKSANSFTENEKILENVLKLLQDNELAVRIMACILLPKIAVWEISQKKLENETGHIIKIYFEILNENDLDDVHEGLEEFLEIFSPQISMISENIIITLTDSLSNVFNSGIHLHKSISFTSKIIEKVLENTPSQLLTCLDCLVEKIFYYALTWENSEIFIEAAQLVNLVLYYKKNSELDWLIKYINLMGNYCKKMWNIKEVIGKVSETFVKFIKQRKEIEYFLEFAEFVITVSEEWGLKLFFALVESLEEKRKDVLERILRSSYQQLSQFKTKRQKGFFIDLIKLAFHKMPFSTMGFLQNNTDYTQIIFLLSRQKLNSTLISVMIYETLVIISVFFSILPLQREDLLVALEELLNKSLISLSAEPNILPILDSYKFSSESLTNTVELHEFSAKDYIKSYFLQSVRPPNQLFHIFTG